MKLCTFAIELSCLLNRNAFFKSYMNCTYGVHLTMRQIHFQSWNVSERALKICELLYLFVCLFSISIFPQSLSPCSNFLFALFLSYLQYGSIECKTLFVAKYQTFIFALVTHEWWAYAHVHTGGREKRYVEV